MQPNGVNLSYFKLKLFDVTKFIVCKDKGVTNQNLWQRHNSFKEFFVHFFNA